MTKTEVVTTPERLTELLTNAEVDVTGILPVNDETLYVSWCYRAKAMLPSPTTSVVIAAFTTAQARLKLFGYLHSLGPRALYYDTDSVFYVSRDGEPDLPIDTTLGSLTDELAGKGLNTYISFFVSGGPKFYAYKCITPNSVEYECKVKGIKLNYTNCQKINFDSVRELITGSSSRGIVLSGFAIRRTDFHEVVTQRETKTCKPVYDKRRFAALNESYPYGYTNERRLNSG